MTIYRSNRAEWLANLLGEQLRLTPPEPFEPVEVIVNTWPTGKWLGEQLSIINGINALTKFPFPGRRLKELARITLEIEPKVEDPWKAKLLVWPIIESLPELIEYEDASLIKDWLLKHKVLPGELNQKGWQIARCIADAFDDYLLYRPELVTQWFRTDSKSLKKHLSILPTQLRWQPLLMNLLSYKIPTDPFSLQVKKVIEKIKDGIVVANKLPKQLHFFGLSSLAPTQIELIQALSSIIDIKVYLITPCPELWKLCKNRREQLGIDWKMSNNNSLLLNSPKLEASLGRMGAEFQQLLEGSGESQLGESQEGDLFAAPVNIALQAFREPNLLERLQQSLISDEQQLRPFTRDKRDNSLSFIACPGHWREIQIVRDVIIQRLAEDKSLEPKDILIMTPQIEKVAPLIPSIFNDASSTDTELPWQITDKSLLDQPGLSQWMIQFLKLSGERITLKELEKLISNPVIQKQQRLHPEDVTMIIDYLQKTGFSWGLNQDERGGNETHSLTWCLERWLLGLAIPENPGSTAGDIAPFSQSLDYIKIAKWWPFLAGLTNKLQQLKLSRSSLEWIELLNEYIYDLFNDGGPWAWERECFLTALEDLENVPKTNELKLDATVVADILSESITSETGRFGHRSGKITISAMEPMRAIPHRVIVIMGLDANTFPRRESRPGFHLLEYKKQLGDPKRSDQDRYVLLEALMSARQSLIVTWNSQNEQSGEAIPPCVPIQQWINQLENELGKDSIEGLLQIPPQSPLHRNNFIAHNDHYPLSCDKRNLEARKWLDKGVNPLPLTLALPLKWDPLFISSSSQINNDLLRSWLKEPQVTWLKQNQLKPREWFNDVQGLDPIELNESQRNKLIYDRFLGIIGSNSLEQRDDEIIQSNDYWKKISKGNGLLPPLSSASLEIELLEERWQSLNNILLNFGTLKRSVLKLKEGSIETFWVGKNLLVVQIGRINSKDIMGGWLNHLLVCSNILEPTSTIFIARKQSKSKSNQFEIPIKLKPIEKDIANSYLQELRGIAIQGLQECWPVPPRSGWAFSNTNGHSSKKGESAFTQAWEGNFAFRGERDNAEMQLCFGRECKATEFLNNEIFKKALASLYSPIVKSLE